MTQDLDRLWSKLTQGSDLDPARESFRFDPVFYNQMDPGIAAAGMTAQEHYDRYGQNEGRPTNRFSKVAQGIPDLAQTLAELITDPELSALLAQDAADAVQLAFELLALGDPVDWRISDFSAGHYLSRYPEVGKAGVNPLDHYLRHGHPEGRMTLRDVRKNVHEGARAFDPAKPTCIIGVHEFSRTGAPIVGIELMRQACDSHNVIALSIRDGVKLDLAREYCCRLILSDRLEDEARFLMPDLVDKIDFAVLNSVECYPFKRFLIAQDIPYAMYLHEYTDYTLPQFKPLFSALFSDLLVFSAQPVMASWQRFLDDIAFDADRDAMVVPQAALQRGALTKGEAEKARQRISHLVGRDLAGKRIVYAAGHAQWRKGTDLFVSAAQIHRGISDDTVYIWIGDGLNPEDPFFGVWMDKHMREAGANDPQSNLFFLPAGDYYDDLCAAADVMFMASRLDPLPNVVFDAYRAGCHVLTFEGGSGFDDPLYADHEGLSAVEYANPAAAAQAIAQVPLKAKGLSRGWLSRPKDAPKGFAPMFDPIAQALAERIAARPDPVTEAGSYDVPVLFSGDEAQAEGRRMGRQKFWRLGRRFVWRSYVEAEETLARADNWLHRKLGLARYLALPAGTGGLPAFAVHIHAYFTEDLAEDLTTYAALRAASRIVITTDTEAKRDEITQTVAQAGLSAEVLLVDNKGRDILPFLHLFSGDAPIAGDNEIWCHLHQKKSIGSSPDGDVWRRFLMTILLGDEGALSSALPLIAEADTGLVGAFDPYRTGWYASRRLHGQVARHFPGPLPEHPLFFPTGNMFWVKASVAREMIAMFGSDYPWPNEPIGNDGTVFHLIERLWPAVAAKQGLRSVFVEKADQKRA